LEVRASNTAAQNLYEKNGFHQVGVRKNYYQNSNVSEDALVMHKYGFDD
jgi:[ribosomal protein S18]-alanine N-acetyltransferase